MNRRNFLKTTLAAGTAIVATKLFGFSKYLDPSKSKDLPITGIIDKKDLESGIAEFGIFNPKGTLLSRKTFTPILVNDGDTVEFKYTITITEISDDRSGGKKEKKKVFHRLAHSFV